MAGGMSSAGRPVQSGWATEVGRNEFRCSFRVMAARDEVWVRPVVRRRGERLGIPWLGAVVLAGVLLAFAAPWLNAAPASAADLIVTPAEGPPGMKVTIVMEGFAAPCGIRFGGLLVATPVHCGFSAQVVSVPSNLHAGPTTVVAFGSAGDGFVQQSVPFNVTGTADVPVCSRGRAVVARFALSPATGAAGSIVDVDIHWVADACVSKSVRLAFDDLVVVDPVPVSPRRVRLSFEIPRGAAPGPHRVALLTPDDAPGLAEAEYVVEQAPAPRLDVTPADGGAGTNVVVTVTDFPSPCQIELGDQVVTIDECAAYSAVLVIPPSADAGPVDVVATGGTGASALRLAFAFMVIAPPGGPPAPVVPEAGDEIQPPQADLPPSTGGTPTPVSPPPAEAGPEDVTAGPEPARTPAPEDAAPAPTPPPPPEDAPEDVAAEPAAAPAPVDPVPAPPPRQPCVREPTVERVVLSPARARPGSDVTATITWPAGACASTTVRLMVGDAPVGDTVAVVPGVVSVRFQLPGNLPAGGHNVSLVVSDEPSRVLATARVHVTEGRSPLPRLLVAVALAGSAALLLSLLALFRATRLQRPGVLGLPDGGAVFQPRQTDFLVYPSDGALVDGAAVLFRWARPDILTGMHRFRVVVKEHPTDWSPENAMRDGDVVVDTLVDDCDFLIVERERLAAMSPNFVWQVTALAEWAPARPEPVVASQPRFFTMRTDQASDEPAELPPGDGGNRNADCVNGDLEMCTLAGWKAYTGNRGSLPSINFLTLTPGVVNGRHTIRKLSHGADPRVGAVIPQVSEGSCSVRLGDWFAGSDADVLAYTFTVTPANQIFTFRYALVMQESGHEVKSERPTFGYAVLKGSGIVTTAVTKTGIAWTTYGDSTDSFYSVSGMLVYRPWTLACLNLSPYLGQTMTIVFSVADCAWGEHWGYAYIDGLCTDNAATARFKLPLELCVGSELWADGSASINESSYVWGIAESDAYGNWNPVTEKTAGFSGEAGKINLTTLYAGLGGKFVCDKYYRIKLAVSGTCTAKAESVNFVHVRCGPPVSAGPDICVSPCVVGPLDPVHTVRIGLTPRPGPDMPTYSWSPAVGLDDPSSPTPNHRIGSVSYPAIYTLRLTDQAGCTSSDQVTLYCDRPSLQLMVEPGCCGTVISATASGYETLKWSTGAVDLHTLQTVTPGTYSVTASNACGTVGKSVVVPAGTGRTGPFNPIAYNSRFCPPNGTSSCESRLHIKDPTTGNGAKGVPNAYNAHSWELVLYDRWGNQFKTVSGKNCALSNWDIQWDGTDAHGNLVQQDTYSFRLYLTNCERERESPKQRTYEKYCARWIRLFKWKVVCINWDTRVADVDFVVGSVTVLR